MMSLMTLNRASVAPVVNNLSAPTSHRTATLPRSSSCGVVDEQIELQELVRLLNAIQ